MADLVLDHLQRKTLCDALLAAFPTPHALARLTAHGLGVNLSAVASHGTLTDQVFELVEWAGAQGRLGELVQAARAENPGNPRLLDFAAQHLTDGTPAAAPPRAPPPVIPPGVAVDTPTRVEWTPTLMYDALLRLLPVQLEEVVFRLAVPSYYLPPPNAPVAERAQGLVRLIEQQSRLGELAALLDKMKLKPR